MQTHRLQQFLFYSTLYGLSTTSTASDKCLNQFNVAQHTHARSVAQRNTNGHCALTFTSIILRFVCHLYREIFSCGYLFSFRTFYFCLSVGLYARIVCQRIHTQRPYSIDCHWLLCSFAAIKQSDVAREMKLKRRVRSIGFVCLRAQPTVTASRTWLTSFSVAPDAMLLHIFPF